MQDDRFGTQGPRRYAKRAFDTPTNSPYAPSPSPSHSYAAGDGGASGSGNAHGHRALTATVASPSPSPQQEREMSEGFRNGTVSVAPGGACSGPLAGHDRLRAQSEWIQLPSVSYGLSMYSTTSLCEPLFSLTTRQQPKRGLAIGSSQMALRTARSVPLDPPPVCELLMNRSGDEHTLSLPEVFVRSQLVKAEGPYDEILPDARRNEALVGDTLQSPFNSRIESREDQCFFVFKEMGVRTKGVYRIRFDLFDRVGLSVRRMASVYSDAFEVHERRKHPGLSASSWLMDALVDRGMKYKLRKPVSPKVAGKKRKAELDDDYTSAEQQQQKQQQQQPPYDGYTVSGAYGRSAFVQAEPAARLWPSNGYDRPSATAYSREGWRQPAPRHTSPGLHPREPAERTRPEVPRWNPDSIPHLRLSDMDRARASGSPTSSLASSSNKRNILPPLRTYPPPPPALEDGRFPPTSLPVNGTHLRQPSLPQRHSSGTQESNSSLSTPPTHRPSASSINTSVTPSPHVAPVDEGKPRSPPSAAGATTKLPGIASLVDAAAMGTVSPFQQSQRNSRSPPWLPRLLDGTTKRRASESLFDDRPI